MVVNACEQLSQRCCFLPPGVLAELDGTRSVNCLDLYWPFSFTLSLSLCVTFIPLKFFKNVDLG